MAANYKNLLLYTDRQITEFRARYGGYISSQKEAFARWIGSWPAREWIDYLAGVPEQNIPIIIGTICILIVDKTIDAEFNETATRLRRCWTEEEREAYWNE